MITSALYQGPHRDQSRARSSNEGKVMSADEYLIKIAAFKDAAVRRADIVRAVKKIADDLSAYPDKFRFSGCSGGLPPIVAMDRGAPNPDARDWPSAQMIQDALIAWHSTRAAADAAWNSLTPAHQGVLKRPDDQAGE